MNVLDLFSGIGGFSLGLERAGMRTVAFCEIDPYCRRVLEKHWPGVPILEDVTRAEFPRADIITGGFPCQDLSFAGDGAGLAGKRSGLYRELIRAIRLVRPRFAIVENVAALLGRGMGAVLGDLAEIGYDTEWHCIPARAVGAPHRRDRVWIIANARGEQHEGPRAPFSGALAAGLSQAAADADSDGFAGRSQCDLGEKAGLEASWRDDVVRCRAGRSPEDWWSTEPDVGRVANGVPSRVDRLKGLGNAVVPQIPEIIGRAIMRAARDVQ